MHGSKSEIVAEQQLSDRGTRGVARIFQGGEGGGAHCVTPMVLTESTADVQP